VEAKHPDLVYISVGRFVLEFSHLELMIRHALIVALQLNFEYVDVIAASYDFRTLCNVTKKVFLCRFPSYSEAEQKDIENLLNECMSVNDERVRIAHGTWYVDESGSAGVRHVSRATLEPKFFYSHIKNLDRVTDKLQKLKSRLAKFLIPRS
jgi:hypothetical protein